MSKPPIEIPVTEVQRRQAVSLDWWERWRFWLFVSSLGLGVLVMVVVGYMSVWMLWYHGGRGYPAMEAHFKHGSIGAELESGMPLRIMRVLPKVFPEHFGGSNGGWSHFGLIVEGERDQAGERRYVSSGWGGRAKPGADKAASEDLERRAAAEQERVSKGLPVGFATGWRRGIEVAWFNCAVCHTGVVQLPRETRSRIISGMPANTVNLEMLFLALFEMAVDKRFTLAEFEKQFAPDDRLRWGERLLWDWVVVPATRNTLIRRRSELLPLLDPLRANDAKLQMTKACTAALKSPEATRSDRQRYAHCGESFRLIQKTYEPYRPSKEAEVTHWGPGRVDTFNPYKMINFGMEADCLTKEERLGASDFPSIFLQGPRGAKNMHLHWDGNNASIRERNLSASLGAGVSEATVDHGSLERIVKWLEDLQPPPSPYPGLDAFDKPGAARGRGIYMRECASCHGYQGEKGYVFEGERLGQIEPIEYVATDRGRLDSYTPLMEKYQKDRLFCSEPEHRFRQFKKTAGYANMPLDGLWLRAPYLHNGSVPTLEDLLKVPGDRPRYFARGRDLVTLDPSKGGFVAPSCIPSAAGEGETGLCFDTTLPGNGNGGHHYGTGLQETEKRDLLSYLLTF